MGKGGKGDSARQIYGITPDENRKYNFGILVSVLLFSVLGLRPMEALAPWISRKLWGFRVNVKMHLF